MLETASAPSPSPMMSLFVRMHVYQAHAVTHGLGVQCVCSATHWLTAVHSLQLLHCAPPLPSYMYAGVLETASAPAPKPNDEYGCAHALYLDLGDLNSVEAFAGEWVLLLLASICCHDTGAIK